MAKQISANLSVSGINQLIKQLKDYERNLEKACETFTERLADVGMKEAKARLIQTRGLDEDKEACDVSFTFDKFGKIMCGTIYLTGEEALYVEFGSGIRYNNMPNPLIAENGLPYGVGTHSFKGHWNDPKGWIYGGEDGSAYHSYGVEATMPLYNARVKIMNQVVSVAKEVFQNVI